MRANPVPTNVIQPSIQNQELFDHSNIHESIAHPSNLPYKHFILQSDRYIPPNSAMCRHVDDPIIVRATDVICWTQGIIFNPQLIVGHIQMCVFVLIH
jgi:hypothetical protein